MIVNRFIGAVQRSLGKSEILRSFFIRVRNQVTAVLHHGLNDGIEMDKNGESWLIDLIARDSSFFIDVGGNKGAWTARYVAACRTAVHGLVFEPSPEAAEMLKTMVDQHWSGRIEIIEAAVSDTVGQSTFFAEPGCGETSSLLQGVTNAFAVARQVEVTTIDAEIARRSLGHIDMLKIDTEGYDLHVLRGAVRSLQRQLIDVVQFEYNAPWAYANSTLHEALEIFVRNGYRVFLLRADGLEIYDYKVHGEFYKYANFVALSERGAARLAEVLP